MKIPSKLDLILWGLAAAAAVTLLLVVKSWHDRAVYELPAVKAQAKQLQANYTALEQRTAQNAAKTERHGNEFDTQEQQLEADRADTPTRDVRLCVDSNVPAARAAARKAPIADPAAGAEAGVIPEGARRDTEAGPDIGADLYALADKADDVALIAERCQIWVKDNP